MYITYLIHTELPVGVSSNRSLALLQYNLRSQPPLLPVSEAL